MKKLLLLSGLLVVVGASIYFYLPAPAVTQDMRTSSDVVPSYYVQIDSRVPPPGYNHYFNEEYQFSLFYKKNLSVQEFREVSRAFTVTFQDEETAEGFQVYVVPYVGTEISEEQFKRDVPSGVRKKEMKTDIGGREAVIFESEHDLLGPTIELWTIEYGYLYEITAELPQKELLLQVQEDWRFY